MIKIKLVNTGKVAPLNKQYIQEIINKYGYKRENDPIIKEWSKLLNQYNLK